MAKNTDRQPQKPILRTFDNTIQLFFIPFAFIAARLTP
jgi:hypothetical protein